MNRIRRSKLFAFVFLFVGVSATVSLLLIALNENINLFYAPDKIVSGEAPHGTTIRAGGMVAKGSLTYEAKDLGVLLSSRTIWATYGYRR